MFTFVLALHIFGAIVMSISAVFLLLGAFFVDLPRTRLHTRILAWALGFELVTGSLLAIVSPNVVSVSSFCQNIGLYVLLTGALFLVSALRVGATFPQAPVLVPVIPSFIMAVLTAVSLA